MYETDFHHETQILNFVWIYMKIFNSIKIFLKPNISVWTLVSVLWILSVKFRIQNFFRQNLDNFFHGRLCIHCISCFFDWHVLSKISISVFLDPTAIAQQEQDVTSAGIIAGIVCVVLFILLGSLVFIGCR